MRLLTNHPRDIERVIRGPRDAPVFFEARTVDELPDAADWPLGFCGTTNGRKTGEGPGLGTGCPVWSDGTQWLTFYNNNPVQD
jgi:hypothetical protein